MTRITKCTVFVKWQVRQDQIRRKMTFKCKRVDSELMQCSSQNDMFSLRK